MAAQRFQVGAIAALSHGINRPELLGGDIQAFQGQRFPSPGPGGGSSEAEQLHMEPRGGRNSSCQLVQACELGHLTGSIHALIYPLSERARQSSCHGWQALSKLRGSGAWVFAKHQQLERTTAELWEDHILASQRGALLCTQKVPSSIPTISRHGTNPA